MDERDFQILVELMRDPTASYESMGRVVSLSGTAVHNRLDRMFEAGPLVGLAGMPHAVVFDRKADVLWARPSGDVRGLLDRLLSVDPVVWVSHLHSGEVAVMVYCARDQEPPVGKLESVLSVPFESSGGYGGSSGDSSDALLSRLDWRVMAPLVRDPRMSVTDLATESGLTRNTARKRRDRLFEHRLLALFPLLQTARAPGLMLYNVIVDVEHGEQLNAVQQILPHAYLIVRHDLDGAQGATFLGHCDTIAAISLAVEDVKRLPGVKRVKLVVDLERLFAFERVEGWVKEKAGSGETG